MRGRRGKQTKYVAALIAAAWVSVARAFSAESLQIQNVGQVLALVYDRPLDLHVDVEVSNDLSFWELINTRDSVINTIEGVETIKSVVDSEGASRLFFRLLFATRRDVTLQWDPVDGSDVAGYHIHLKRLGETRERLIDVGNTSLATLSMPRDGRVYFFCVTTYNQSGGESDCSGAVGVRTNP